MALTVATSSAVMESRRRGAWATARAVLVRACVLGLAGSTLVVLAPATAASAATRACADAQSTGAAAAAMAKSCHRPVEDMSLRTESTTTVHNADGTQRLTRYVEPHFGRDPDGTWGEVDTTLRLVDGRVAPVRSALPVSFSAGGTSPLARVGHGKGAYEVALQWPGPLPAPTLAGDTATYLEVYPGVDLRVTAQATGFSEVLVVKDRAAAANPALRRIGFGLTANGVTVSSRADGSSEARNAKGEVVFTSPTPVMWDSSGADGGAPDRAGQAMPRTARVVRMAAKATPSTLEVIPDAAMLASPDVTYPLYIDPSWNGVLHEGLWKNVASRWDVVNDPWFTLTGSNGDAGAGLVCDYSYNGSCTSTPYVVRSLFMMQLGGALGKHVLSATFNITQTWAWQCWTPTNARLSLTGGLSWETTWNTQPEWDFLGFAAYADGNHRNDWGAGCNGPGNDAFDVTSAVQVGVASGWGTITFGLIADCECTVNQWKKFSAGTASLSILYNSYPNVPDTLTTAGQSSCVTGSGRPLVAVTNPVLSARVTDPDGAGEGDIGGVLQGEFSYEAWNASTSTWSALGTAVGTPQGNGTTSPSPAPTFVSGGIFRWRARALDSWSVWWLGSGTDASAYTGWCEFEVDAVAPKKPTVVADANNAPFVTGRTVRLTLQPGGSPADRDITGYSWWVVDGAGTHATTFTSGSTVTIDWTPIAGQATVHMKAKDRIQLGPESTYVFNAAQAAPEVARWALNEPPGSTVAADSTALGHDATVALSGSATLGAPGRIIDGDSAVSFNGAAGNNITTAGPVLDLSRSYTVSAWVKLGDKSATHVLASQFGTDNSGFTLEYTAGAGEDRWEMLTFGANAVGTGRIRSTVVPKVGVWTHVTGVYNSAARTIRLYVNGVAQSSQSSIVGLNNGGTMRIGRAVGQPFSGSVSDVRAWDRVLSGPEVLDLYDPTSAGNLATANVGSWFVEPASCFGDPATICQDSSSYAHDVDLSGGVVTTTAGHTGSGLQYNATDGVASTAGPVLHTDASFTVSAWVKLDSLPVASRTAIGESGTAMSPFYLGTRMSGTTPRWAFAMADTDTASTPVRTALSAAAITSADVGGWFHLVGVYDAQAATISLYVNGTLAGTAAQDTRWDATGPLTIGAALVTAAGAPQLGDGWNGTIDTVTVYAGAVPATSISRIP